MYIYADRILIKILAFSLGPVIGLGVTAFSNYLLGLIIGILAFCFTFFQPDLSDLCLKNTAKDLKIYNIRCAEGKVKLLGYSREDEGKLYLTEKELIFVKNNEIDLIIPISSIVNFKIINEQIKENNKTKVEIEKVLDKNSPNLIQIVNILENSTPFLYGILSVKIKKSIFFNQYDFLVSNPRIWSKKLRKVLKSKSLGSVES